MKDILDLKPNIIIGDNYEGTLTLDAWKGFQSRQGPYGSIDSRDKSNGTVKVMVTGYEVDYVKISSQAQINSLKYLADNSKTIRDALLVTLLKEFSNLKGIYGDALPELHSIEEFKNYIGLAIVHVLASDKDDFSYIGFEIGCTWDEEHGVGVMTHKDKVVAIGQADTAFNLWDTYKDNGTRDTMSAKWDSHHKHGSRPWWKFWN